MRQKRAKLCSRCHIRAACPPVAGSVKKAGARELILGSVIVRAGEGHSLEAHIDTDEANAAGMLWGELLELIK